MGGPRESGQNSAQSDEFFWCRRSALLSYLGGHHFLREKLLEVTKEKLTRENRRVVNLDIKRHGGPNRVLSLPILHHLPNHTQTKPSFELNLLNINMSEVHNSHFDTAELESFEEFEAEGRRYQTDVDLAVLMNSFGLASDNSVQSGPGDQAAVAETVYSEQRDDEHEGRVNESISSGTRSADTFDGNEDQVTFTGLASTTPLVIDLDDEDEDERVDVDALEIYGNNDHD